MARESDDVDDAALDAMSVNKYDHLTLLITLTISLQNNHKASNYLKHKHAYHTYQHVGQHSTTTQPHRWPRPIRQGRSRGKPSPLQTTHRSIYLTTIPGRHRQRHWQCSMAAKRRDRQARRHRRHEGRKREPRSRH